MDFSGDHFIEKARQLNRSEEFIRTLENYIIKLNERELPVILSPQHWALRMGIDYEQLSTVIDNREKYYDHYRIRKKSGGWRAIQAPKPELYNIQLWLKTFILDKLEFPKYLTSYQRQKSIIDNAAPHVAKEIVVKFDLRNFFETITQDKVQGLFRLLGYGTAVAIDMAKACCVPLVPQDLSKQNIAGYACLPQGAPSSPALSNLAGFKLDIRLHAYAKSKHFAYSRYADDLTFSGDFKMRVRKSVIQSIIQQEGFVLNPEKVHYLQRSNKQVVTGITVNEKMAISKKFRKSVHTQLHNAVRFGPYYHMAINKLYYNNYREWLLGNILYIKQLHPIEAAKMKRKFEMINWL